MAKPDRSKPGPNRRTVLTTGAALPLAIAGAQVGRPPTAAAGSPPKDEARSGALAPRADYVLDISSKKLAPLGVSVDSIVVNGGTPGPEIRYAEGDMFRVLLQNLLDQPTSVHWHGLIVPNWMDGVPDLTQLAIPPKNSFFVEYPIVQSGSYWYHSHYQLQEQEGLHGPYIIEEKRPIAEYDYDVVCFGNDWLNQSAYDIVPQIRGEQKKTRAVEAPKGDLYNLPGSEKPFNIDVNYPGFILNAHTNEDPWAFQCKAGDRIRLRLINGATSATFRVALDGHEMTIIACDGNPCEPITVDSIVIAVAERYDVLVTIRESGSFTLHWACVGQAQQVVGVIHTADVKAKPNLEHARFGPRTGGMADYRALRAPDDTRLPDGPVKTFRLDLGGMMQSYLWTMGGQLYPEVYVPEKSADAEPLNIELGDRVRVSLTNSTMMYHPMHLHGHFFRLLAEPGNWQQHDAVLKDTVGVPPGGQVDFEFYADNPGHWFFHCHNLFHLAAGMARVFHYGVQPGGQFAPPSAG